MPNYTFKDTETGEVFDLTMKIAELDEYKQANPTHQQVLSAVPMGDPVQLGVRKIDNGFREVLQKISERAPGAQALKDSIR